MRCIPSSALIPKYWQLSYYAFLTSPQ